MLHRKMILPMVAMFLVALAAWTGVGCAADSDAPLTDSEARQFEEILIGVYESSMTAGRTTSARATCAR